MNKEIKEDTSKKEIKLEESIYKEVHLYPSEHCYPPDSTKEDKCIIRKREKKFQLIDGSMPINVQQQKNTWIYIIPFHDSLFERGYQIS